MIFFLFQELIVGTYSFLPCDVGYLSHCIWLQWSDDYPIAGTSQCVFGFLYTLVFKLPSPLMMTRVSKKGMEPSPLLASFVNWILSSMLFMSLKLSTFVFWMITNVSSTNLLLKVGGCGAVLMASFSKASIYKLVIMGLNGEPMAAPFVCSWYLPWKMKHVLLRQNSNRQVVCCAVMDVLC